MKILQLRAENVKRLGVVEITPNGNVVVIGGKNGAGKTSVLDSIWYALGGKAASPSDPIHHGKETAEVTVTFGNGVVLYQDIPLDQCSSAERLRVSVSIGLAMNPKLKVLLIRDGSLLDEDNLQMIATMAEKADAQVWIERVGDGEECSVVIEDGQVRDA